MYRVSGIVLVKETQAAIPNLQVVLYDLDVGGPNANSTRHWEPRNAEGEGWLGFSGDRLGSVLTDAAGRFEFGPEAFGSPNAKERPDLLLLVMAPEDTAAELAGLPAPLPAKERVLHVSSDVVLGSGKHEGYVIRLPRERLEKLAIPEIAPAPRDIRLDTDRITASYRESANVSAAVNKARSSQIRKQLRPVFKLKRQTDAVFRDFDLSRVPDAVRSLPTYLKPGEDVRQNQDSVVNKALSSIPGLDAAAGVTRKLQIAATEAQIGELGLSIGTDGAVWGDVDAGRFLRHVTLQSDPNELTFSSRIFSACVELEAERRLRDAMTRCQPAVDDSGSGCPAEEPATTDFTTDELVREHVARQMKHAESPEVELTYGIERDGEITATITRPGPAEVTSFHDFHVLQIAFDHIWTEAFDGTINRIVREVYAEAVRYSNEVSGVPEDLIESINDPVTSVDDLRRLYDDVRLLQTLIENEQGQRHAPSPSTPRESVPDDVKALVPEITETDWARMTSSNRAALLRLAAQRRDANTKKAVAIAAAVFTLGASLSVVPELEGTMTRARQSAQSILRSARARARAEGDAQSSTPTRRRAASSRLQELMQELDERMSSRYKFDVFAPDSINYGVMLTYRQAWTPKDYQVADLLSTIPLAPKEVRRYSKKRVVKRSRAQKELEDSQSSRRSEASSTARADQEIVKRASNKTSFQQTAEGGVNIGVFEGSFGTRFGIDAEKASSSTKKNFREAVQKAAEEYKQQHRVEVETTVSEELEVTDSGEISNPNDEITVTYLFYELQRQYQVSEQIHRLTPVILVANEVPAPHEIDEDWLIAHHWILRRVILDDAYLPALDYVNSSFVGDEMALEVMWSNLRRQADLVDELIEQSKKKQALADGAFAELQRLTSTLTDKNDLDKLKDINLAAAFGPFAIAGLIGGDEDAAEKREEIAKLAIERADKEVQQASARLSREVTALQQAIDKYIAALREHLDRQTAVAALRVHVKDNILCYMHAIWDHQCGDQRFFRVYNIEVPWVEVEAHTISVSGWRRDGFPGVVGAGDGYILEGELTLSRAHVVRRKLSEVADLDNMLGYKGNYMIFPVKEPNHLHWYLMQDYIDPDTGGLRDPDGFGNHTTQDLLDYACCLSASGVDASDERVERILGLLKERLASPRQESELIVVPTDSLYIEALPGKDPILEDFKLVHRAIDVKKVQAEVRHDELENVRLAARLLEAEREDPDIERKIVIEGDADNIIVPSES